MAHVPEDLALSIWGHLWVHHDSTMQLRRQVPAMLAVRWWPFWELLCRQAATLALWGPGHTGWPAAAGQISCISPGLSMLPPPPHGRWRTLPSLPPPPPRFSYVVRGDQVACVVRERGRGRLWLGRVGSILQNTTPHLGRWRRLHCGDFALVQIHQRVLWWRRSSVRLATSWCVL